MKKALAVITSLAIAAMLWLGAAKTLSAAHHDTGRPVTTRGAAQTEVLRVQTIEVNSFEVDMHDGGQWDDQPSESDRG